MIGEADEISDIIAGDRKWAVMLVDSLRADPSADPLMHMRRELIAEIARRYRDDAQDQAGQEACDNGQFGVGA